MQPRKKALVAAASGTAIGLAGLAFIAMPAGAGEAPPELPAVSAEDLVQSVLTAQAPALSGTVTVSEQLGLPAALPGVGTLDLDEARVFNDGNGKTRLAIKQGGAENTVVHDGATVWSYNSADNTATKVTLPAGAGHGQHEGMTEDGQLTDPTAVAGQLLQAVREFSTVTVDGTARVADRPAYELVLTPKPDERTLLREIRVAVDSETRLPLRLEVLTNGTTEPALEIGFSEFAVEQQPADLFAFTPPAGAKIDEVTPEAKPDQAEADKAKEAVDPQVVGEGWDSVITGRVPADALAGGKLPAAVEGQDGGEGLDVQALLGQIAKPVSGPFGTGHVITTKVGTALLTDDGRFAAGAVPEQVLIDALGAK
ncbi:LolA family protein [Amycolatopsis magusensis]|uniref:Outer membrane lipoprotein-sorting protein n=1 Tax=Amycolatopsis magusensis TaxID=882444 RepID=A0ABS4PH60_9PSEU|nr:sigma-E factor regulatory protein RseB domain-containing protein [Amycolatopsis magusensis]MBP2178720.1 outer membrane lipoprotein-sorting protein [Amycolatopsis magusensis]MDI5974759.1 sigma-E factor regulatory protein RseB domain-containing protein [Amycolatopsis magusensis]